MRPTDVLQDGISGRPVDPNSSEPSQRRSLKGSVSGLDERGRVFGKASEPGVSASGSFSSRFSLRIESARICQTVCFTVVAFLPLPYSRS